MIWQPRHEDIIGTFLFFLITGFAVFQIMIGYRHTRGLSFYGESIRPAVNYIVGGLLLVGGFAWYFSNPANRNVPGIEGFMSLVCMALGFAVAALLSAFLPTLVAWFRRRRAYGRATEPALNYIYRGPEGELAVTGPPPEGFPRMAALVSDLDGITRVPSRMAGALAASGKAVALLAPAYLRGNTGATDSGVYDGFTRLLDRLAEWAQNPAPLELDVAGLGLGADLVSRMPAEGPGWRARRLLLLNPRPDEREGASALQSVTPGDILDIAWRERIWASARMRRIWGMAAIAAIICVLAGTATTFAVGVRWWPVSGTLAGLLASAWLSYLYMSWRHPELIKGGYDKILEDVRAQMRERPFASVPIPRYVRFARHMSSRATVAEIDDLLSRPD